MVTQGFHGDIIEDIFDRGQVMVLCAISRQNRVVGIFTIGGHSKLMSIPEEYTEKLCIIKRGIVTKEDQLYKILRNNPLPTWVEFPRDRVLTVDNRGMNTNHIPPIELTKRFDEVYLLGNTILDGKRYTKTQYERRLKVLKPGILY
ncbi:uncharacterized protein LOC128549266 [Mercenaria mercenaria]|uniref:uncharacterized protein LOC128549266 n=1 Tax=Mercenaria mercenaria TaxID=6596 RepID=UPI00234F5662|nr:uncharacterized protein LOC128549266 [Mercenaria mercenaria]